MLFSLARFTMKDEISLITQYLLALRKVFFVLLTVRLVHCKTIDSKYKHIGT